MLFRSHADREDALVVRVSETWGARGRVRLTTSLPVVSARRVDLLERDLDGPPLACDAGTVVLDLRPFELVTLKFARRT